MVSLAGCRKQQFKQPDQPRNARGRPKTQELPMVLLAIQEIAARAATRDRHLRRGAQLAVAKTAS